MKKIIIAIDGHAGCGKSTTAKAVARKMNYIYIDTGAMYRATTYYILENKIDIQDITEVKKALGEISLRFAINDVTGNIEIYLNGESAESKIRTMEITSKVSDVASIPEVRHFLVDQQQKMGTEKGIVMDGRDIGTVVFPNAELKVFMTSDVEVRAKRRQIELESKGEQVNFEDVLEDLKNRDHLDSTRKEGPLKVAQDARIVDTTNTTIEEQIDIIYQLAKEVAEAQ
ncbi:(d)CMP kinase [Limibacter armeniacum]|uniref:(d)CMP kinase n=1 Tax=Limibacter armeniacum TaxID=466084 RepID=UPI002FE6329F